MEMTGETFSEKMLSVCRKRDEYFDKDGMYRSVSTQLDCHVNESGKLLRIEKLFPMPLEQAIMNYDLPEAEAAPAAAFIRSCLHLNPEERASASDLEVHPWLERAFMCC